MTGTKNNELLCMDCIKKVSSVIIIKNKKQYYDELHNQIFFSYNLDRKLGGVYSILYIFFSIIIYIFYIRLLVLSHLPSSLLLTYTALLSIYSLFCLQFPTKLLICFEFVLLIFFYCLNFILFISLFIIIFNKIFTCFQTVIVIHFPPNSEPKELKFQSWWSYHFIHDDYTHHLTMR